MKNREFRAIAKRLTPHLSELIFKDRLMFLLPVAPVLRGFCFETSGFAKEVFYLWVFFQPLFVPAKEIRFTFGSRLESGSGRWRIDEHELESSLLFRMKAEIPKLLGMHNATNLASSLEKFTKPNAVGYVNPHCREAFAYALIQANQPEKANHVLANLMKSIDTTVAWQREIESRAARIQEMLLKRPEDATEQLKVWEVETAHNLGLEEFFGPKQ